jgi:hypothetical protein
MYDHGEDALDRQMIVTATYFDKNHSPLITG